MKRHTRQRQKRLFGTGYEPVADKQPVPPHSGSETSRDAAEAINPKTSTQRRVVLNYLLSNPSGATDDEMQESLRLPGNSQRPRRRELELAGLVKDSGRRRDKKIVWVAVNVDDDEPMPIGVILSIWNDRRRCNGN